MKQCEDLTGAVLHSEREYDIAPETAVVVGQVVKLKDGLVVPAEAAETGAILGYAAESHSGAEEALNERANGKRILVQDSPTAVAVCPAPMVTATGGTATTVTCEALAGLGEGFVGGYVKGPGGQVRRVTGCTTTSITVEKGEIPEAGDVYVLFPPVGFAGGNLSEDGTKLVLTATAALPLQVIGRDEGSNSIKIVAKAHALAASGAASGAAAD